MNYSSIVWLPICAVATAIGLVLSYYYGRRHGHLSMLRGAAWSLLPIAAYLTGSVEMFWRIGEAIGHYADGFVFSPVKWAGIGVAGISALLFFSTGGKGRRKAARLARRAARAERKQAADGTDGAITVSKPGTTRALDTLTLDTKEMATAQAKPRAKNARAGKPSAGADDDMKDIDDILRKRGL
ncbi:MAG: cellulose synthase [Trebonia sp.]